MTLPWIPLEDLLKRNLHRLQTQGRFIPAFAIADCCQRVTAMVSPNVAAGNDGGDGVYKSVEEVLVTMASPSTNTGRGPRRNDQRRPNATFQYILTKQRLIQKQYPRNNAGHPSSNSRQNNLNRNTRNYDEGRQPRPRDQNQNNNNNNGKDSNGSYRHQSRQHPDQEEPQSRSRRRYNGPN